MLCCCCASLSRPDTHSLPHTPLLLPLQCTCFLAAAAAAAVGCEESNNSNSSSVTASCTYQQCHHHRHCSNSTQLQLPPNSGLPRQKSSSRCVQTHASRLGLVLLNMCSNLLLATQCLCSTLDEQVLSLPPGCFSSVFNLSICRLSRLPSACCGLLPPVHTSLQAKDGVCDDGRFLHNMTRGLASTVLCDLGTDCSDCGPYKGVQHSSSWCVLVVRVRVLAGRRRCH